MAELTVEVAGLADAVAKANRITPNKGTDLERYGGIVIEVDENERVLVRSSNGVVTYAQVLDANEQEGTPIWRFPSKLFTDIVGGLALGSGQVATFSDTDRNTVQLISGRTKARIPTIEVANYPSANLFRKELLQEVPALHNRLTQVVWATGDTDVLVGVHITGKEMVATDKYKLVKTPCEVPVDEPITALVGDLMQYFSQSAAMMMGIADGVMYFMPDEFTYITSRLIGAPYPAYYKIIDQAMSKPYAKVFVDREELLATITRVMVVGKTDRCPKISFWFEEGGLKVFIDAKDIGAMEDWVDITIERQSEYTQGWPMKINFNPTHFMNCLSVGNLPTVELGVWGPLNMVRVKDDDDYECWIMPVRDVAPAVTS